MEFLEGVLCPGAANQSSVRLQTIEILFDIVVKVAMVTFQASYYQVILLGLTFELPLIRELDVMALAF